MKSAADRFKRYEASYSVLIPPRTYTIVRVDGKGFSKFTKKMVKPFDNKFSESMNYAALEMCKYFNPDFAYTQSDEISLVFTDFGIEAQQMFDGKVQKLCSLTASKAAVSFNKKMLILDAEENDIDMGDFMMSIINGKAIYETIFDSRVFIIPDFREVGNYFVHRQQDATRNSISMAASALYSHKALDGKSGSEKQDMMMDKGVNWNDYSVQQKRGVIIRKFDVEVPISNGQALNTIEPDATVIRKRWLVDYDTPIFTQDREYLNSLIKTIPCPDMD